MFSNMETVFSLALFIFCTVAVDSTRIVFQDNGYEGIVIAINPQVPEDPKLINSLKDIWTDASKYLYLATKSRAYFRNVTILVPETWENGSYSSSDAGETYTAADVLVADPNPIFGDSPYTLQHGECGKPGQYIHITPDYVKLEKFELDTGVKGRVITHEWAHLRWGVFDEVATAGYDDFYLSRGSVEATRCPVSLRGLNLMIDDDLGNYASCSLDPNTLLPQPGCVFVPYSQQPKGLIASLMSHQYLDPVVGFCHSDPNDRTNQHNTAAPNEQNRLCNLRSAWDVIMGTDDFANGANSPRDISETTPTFSVVQHSSSRIVLVMDSSESMRGNRLSDMQRAVSLFVTDYVADGSYVGLVSFGSSGTILSYLRKIDDASRSDLDTIIRRIGASGSASIGSGILKGIEVLKGSSGKCGGNLIVLTDGGENVSPIVADVYDNVISCNVKMYTIFLDLYATSVNQIMTDLSKQSGGDWFLAHSTSSFTDLVDIFQKLSQSDDGDETKKTYQIHSNSLTVSPNAAVNTTMKIDSSVGNHTLFTITWANIMPDILLILPSGCVYASYTDRSLNYCSRDPIHSVDNVFRTYKFNIPGTAPAGEWIYEIKNHNGYPETVTVTVASRPWSSKTFPIEVESRLTLTDMTETIPTVVYAKVTQGFSAVLEANVTAIITTPSSKKVTLPLFDNGAGPDVRKNDGVYSRYFFQYEEKGRYSIQMKVSRIFASGQTSSAGSPSAFNVGVINEDGIFVPNPNGISNLPDKTPQGTTPDDFDRVEAGSSFSYSGPENPGDVYAPNKVTDLSGSQRNVASPAEGVQVSITFSAPGDDMDSGSASKYEIRYSFESATVLLNSFNDGVLVTDDDLVKGNLNSPLPAYTKENIVFKVTNNANEGSVQFYVALRAYDDIGNPSEISNVRPMSLFFEKTNLAAAPTHLPDATPVVGLVSSTVASADGPNSIQKIETPSTKGTAQGRPKTTTSGADVLLRSQWMLVLTVGLIALFTGRINHL